MAKVARKVPVSRRALIARIDRKLRGKDDPERLRATRTARQRQKFGDWFIVDCMGDVIHADIQLEPFGRKLGVLADYETVED